MGKFRPDRTPFLGFYRADFADSKHAALRVDISKMILRPYIRSRVQVCHQNSAGSTGTDSRERPSSGGVEGGAQRGRGRLDDGARR